MADATPLRVGLVLNSLLLGGAQSHVVRLCQATPREQAQLSLFLVLGDEPSVLADQVPKDVPVIVSPYRRHDPRVVRWLAAEMAARRIAVAHSFLWYADAVASLARLLYAPCPLVCSERGDRARELYPKWKMAYDRLVTFRAADRICANSFFGMKLLVRAGARTEKIEVIPNGVDVGQVDETEAVDLRALLGWPASRRIVGTVCRLVWYKGVDVLVKAAAILPQEPDVGFVIVGDGPQRAALEEMAQRLGVGHRVAFLGVRSSAVACVRSFDLAVLATRAETEHCSNSILEYMACGKPVIATDIAGNPEVVGVGETGLLFPPDDAEALARALTSLVLDSGRSARFGAQGRLRVEERFRFTDVVGRFVSMWETVSASTALRFRRQSRSFQRVEGREGDTVV